MQTWGPEHWAFLLLIIGILLLFAEVLIPSAGMIFIAAVVCLLGAIVCAWQAWWETSPNYFWMFLGGMGVALPFVFYWMFKIWSRLLFRDYETEQQMTKTSPDEELRLLLGKTGTAVTPLMPAGIVIIDGERIHASSEGMIVEKNQPVRVVAVKPNRLIVRIYDPAKEASTDLDLDDAVSDDDSPLDFEMSEE